MNDLLNIKEKYLSLHNITLFLIILISDDTLLFGTNSNSLVLYFRAVFYVLISFVLLINNEMYINRRMLLLLLLSIVFISSTILFNHNYTSGYVFYIILLVMSCVYSSSTPLRKFIKSFIDVIYILAAISICLTLVFVLLPESIFTFLPTLSNFADVEFYSLLVYNIPVGSLDEIRNFGVFREPGLYMIYLNLAIAFILFKPKPAVSDKRKYLFVLVFALFLTKSTAGYIIFILIFTAYFVFESKRASKFIMLIPIGLIALFLFFGTNTVFEKMNSDSIQYSSTLARLSSIFIPIEILQIHPFYGVGLKDFVSLYESFSFKLYGIVFKADAHSTNTILNKAAIFGLPYALMQLCALYGFVKK